MESTGREALGDLDRLLGALRHAPSGAEPGLAGLPGLVERFGQAGVQVTVDSDATEALLSSTLSQCAYRIVQAASGRNHHGAARR
jgi:signal transduction histidine kinase